MPDESTTPDLVELTRRAIEAAGDRDLDDGLRAYGRDSVWDMSRLGMGVFEGPEAIRGFLADWIGAYEEYEIALEEIHDLGNGVILAVLVHRGRPAGSTGQIDQRYATINEWADGRMARVTSYNDIDEARAAAERLAEEGGKGVSESRSEIVRAMVDLWNVGEHGSETVAEYFAPAVELESPLSSVHGTPYRGYAGIEQWARDLDEQFAEWSIRLDDVREIGDQVLALGAVDARGRVSDVRLDFPAATVLDFGSDDRAERVRIYTDVGEALRAVGLEE